MKRLRPFAYFEPATMKEAVEIAVERGNGTYFLAGGTDLFVRMKRGEISPSTLVNLKRVKGLNQIDRDSKGGLRIGSLARISEIEGSPLVLSTHPVLAQAAGVLGSPSIRNLATLGGNIGRASPASDTAPALMVLQARVSVEGPHGKKELALDQLFLEPGKTTLSSSEVIAFFHIAQMAPHTKAIYLKLGRRAAVDCALVGVAALIGRSTGGSEVTEVRIALASVGPTPLRAHKAEEILLSGSLTEDRIKKAAEAAVEDASPITDMRASLPYRKEMIKVLTHRALLEALNLSQGEKRT